MISKLFRIRTASQLRAHPPLVAVNGWLVSNHVCPPLRSFRRGEEQVVFKAHGKNAIHLTGQVLVRPWSDVTGADIRVRTHYPRSRPSRCVSQPLHSLLLAPCSFRMVKLTLGKQQAARSNLCIVDST